MGLYNGIIYSTKGVFLVLITGISGHNCSPTWFPRPPTHPTRNGNARGASSEDPPRLKPTSGQWPDPRDQAGFNGINNGSSWYLVDDLW